LREIVLSGFQLELYTAYERPFAYWYLGRITGDHIDLLDSLDPVIPSGRPSSFSIGYK